MSGWVIFSAAVTWYRKGCSKRQDDMSELRKQSVLREFKQIPGVGKKIAEDLLSLGCYSIQDLQDRNPEELYLELCAQRGMHVDRCMLYVFRCIVYYASNERHDPELLKWWNWKDAK